jgi:hypothetical protein
MVTKTKATKKRFSQAEYDRLVTRKAVATLSLRNSRQELEHYTRTHTSGIAHKRKG